MASGQQDDATGTVRIRDPPIVLLREDQSAGVGHDASEGVERQNGDVAAAALAERGLKAVLVAANLRCPTYQTWAMLAAGVG